MPTLPRRRCSVTGCNQLVPAGTRFCAYHERLNIEQYEKSRKPANERGYTASWAKYRFWYLQQNPICAECKRNKEVTLATVVDHIIPMNKGGDFWESSNHQALCKKCHDTKTAKESGWGKSGKYIL